MPDEESKEEKKLREELKKAVRPVTGNQGKKGTKQPLKDILNKGKKK